MSSRWLCLLVCTALLCSLMSVVHAAVMSIDYGTEWFKVGLIKPGIPLDVALNKDSKRKTQSVVTIRDNERIYGSDAVSLAGRFPHLTYSNLKSIMGKSYDDPHCEEYRARSVTNMALDDGRPIFVHNDTALSIEELIAYQFQNAKQQASNTAGENVKDVVITVTPFANQYERQAILDAAELAGLNVLSLMHDETAVALNFAVNRELGKEVENHLFYDMGAGSTVASIVSFSTIKKGKTSSPQLEVKSVGYDRTLGGHELDVRLQNLIADGFMKLNADRVKNDIRMADGAMTRLLKEANRVKQILSANTETMASVENLHEGLDFKMKVTRAELESICSDLIARVQNPMKKALEAASMTVDDIKSVVIVGGGVRVPSVQQELIKLVGAQKIAKNVNGDEAAVLGAAFRGASLSNQFRLTKDISIKDIIAYPIQVAYQPEIEGKEAPAVHTVLFKQFGALGTRKIMTFKRESDFDFDISYGGDELGDIAKVKITGLTAALEKHAEDIKSTEHPPKVRITMEMSDSGIVSVPEAALHVSKASFTDKVKSFFGKDTTKDKAAAEEKEAKEDQQKNDTDASATDAKNDTVVTEQQESKETVIKVPLTVQYIPTGIPPLSEKNKVIAKERIAALDLGDYKKKVREESRNNLETFVYRVQDFLYDDVVALVATEDEIESFREKLSETSDWLYDDGEFAETPVYTSKLRELQSIENPIQFRFKEYQNRQKNINLVNTVVKSTYEFVQGINKEATHYTEEELNGLLDSADDLDKWMIEKIAAQKALLDTQEPAIITSQVLEKTNKVKDQLVKLMAKKKPKVPKKKKEEKTEETKEDKSEKPEETKQDVKEESEKPDHDHDEL